MKTNPTVQKGIRVATIAGASILVVKSALALTGVKSPKEAIMPIISILVGVAAFNYALQTKPATQTTK
jgi:hypothetical protein